jgi:phosphoserine aminotransferase
MSKTIYNFNPGPSILPRSVLERVQKELLDYPGLGTSILEASHRSKEFIKINEGAQKKIADLMGLGDKFKVLFLQGGASAMFSQIPMNLLHGERKKADYIDTGVWANKAISEAKRYGEIKVVASSKTTSYDHIPEASTIPFTPDAVYLHLCSNNTIYGTQWKKFPSHPTIPLVGDFSSDILSKKIDVSPFGLIYGGAQKNLGPAGVTIVIIRKDLLESCTTDLPTTSSFKVQAENDSLYNTPPVFAIYVMNYVLDWINEQGGLSVVEKRNEEKAGFIYDALENAGGFYKLPAKKQDRSLMNIVFTLADDTKSDAFQKEAESLGFMGLKGHRSVGGFRASVYNAFPVEGAKLFSEFLTRYAKKG